MDLKLLNSKKFFALVLMAYLAIYAWGARTDGREQLSSDLLMYQMTMIQEKEAPWSYLPPVYARQDLYVAYPLFYFLNPGLEGGLLSYHLLVVLIIALTYVASGWVINKITRHWGWAALGALLLLVPHNIGLTTIGIEGLGDLRGNIFAFPFYLLLGHYWLIEGVKSAKKNLVLAVLAAGLIYLYPIASIIAVFVFSLTGGYIHRTKYWKRFVIFWLVYLVLAAPFLVVHFSNPLAQMTSAKEVLSSGQLVRYGEIMQYRFRANAFLSTVDLARIKRTIWDTTPLALMWLCAVVVLPRLKPKLTDEEWISHQIGVVSVAVMISFVVFVDQINAVLMKHGQLPIFIEHIRAMRILGFILVTEAVLLLSIFWRLYRRPYLVAGIVGILVFSPLYFSAPLVRSIVRTTVPTSIRLEYNLAPVVSAASALPSFDETVRVAQWVRENLDADKRIFVFSGDQLDFVFKLFSRHDTNLTSKEGSSWTTSDYENATRWFAERERYDQVVGGAKNFTDIVTFARELGMSHVLVPRGPIMDLYRVSKLRAEVVYRSDDYVLISLP